MAATYSKELFNEICARIAVGEGLREICQDDDMPNRGNVFVWMREKDGLRDQYRRAREDQADYFFDEINGLGRKVQADDGIDPTRARVAIDVFKWSAGKLKGKYSDKTILAGDSDNPIAITAVTRTIIPAEKSK